MQTTPKSLRLQIALMGRTNVGKSTFMNRVAGQEVAITSTEPGTTTDVVEKAMELLPFGPVVLLDTAGIDDRTVLARERIAGTRRIFDRADVIVLLCETERFGDPENEILHLASARRTPVIIAVAKADRRPPPDVFIESLRTHGMPVMIVPGIDDSDSDSLKACFISCLLKACPDALLPPPPLVADLLPSGGLLAMLVPIDLQAPKGRLILPQVQAVRDALDGDAAVLIAKEREFSKWLKRLPSPPDLVVCDSQVVMQMVADTPPTVPCTTFSILFARMKGDLRLLTSGAAAIDRLRDGDRVLIVESCTHHALEDDIGRVKIPRWLRQYTGADLHFEHSVGRDFPAETSRYSLAVQCGGCMQTRREVLSRLEKARAAGIPITNYGLCIAHTQGVLRRVLSPFPEALLVLEDRCKGPASQEKIRCDADNA